MFSKNRKSVMMHTMLVLMLFMEEFWAITVQATPSVSFSWAKGIGGVDYDTDYNIALDNNGNIYSVGVFTGMVTIDFDPDAGTNNLTRWLL